MTSPDIYKLLQSKPHNPHYLNRYWKFIQHVQVNPNIGIYTEEHHILPKAKDLFPEYKAFSYHPWNKINLTMEQHLLAHLLLWKAYGGSQAYSVHYMINCSTEHLHKKNKIPPKYKRVWSIKLKQQARENRKGFSTYKDSNGNKYFLHKDDPKINELNLVGNNTGILMSEDAKESMRGQRTITLYYKGYENPKKILRISDSNYEQQFKTLLDDGWMTERSEQSRIEAKANQRKLVSEKLTGIKRNGPRSDKQKEQVRQLAYSVANNKDIQLKKSKTVSELKWCHDPVTKINTRLKDVPNGWVLGKYGNSPISGSTTWNDGVRNYRVKVGESPNKNWTKGMVRK